MSALIVLTVNCDASSLKVGHISGPLGCKRSLVESSIVLEEFVLVHMRTWYIIMHTCMRTWYLESCHGLNSIVYLALF